MIIFRYLILQLLLATFAITLVLMCILLSTRFIGYLAQASAGEIAVGFLLPLILYRIPDILQMILPLSFLIAILLCYGRLHLDSEIVVLSACGFTPRRLVIYTLVPALFFGVIVGFLSLVVGPWGLQRVDRLFSDNAKRTEFDIIQPGRFEKIDSSNRVIYTEMLSSGRTRMENIFLSESTGEKLSSGRKKEILIVAENGYLETKENSNSRFFILENGYRYSGLPGDPDYLITKFETYALEITDPLAPDREPRTRGKPTWEIIKSDDLSDQAELQWRISLAIMAPTIALLGIPLSRVNPREGRYRRLLPAIFLYMGYLVLLSTMKRQIGEGNINPMLGLWWVHGLFLFIGVILNPGLYWTLSGFTRK